MERENVIGQKFGRLTVIEDAPDYVYKSGRNRVEKCKCDCGKITFVKLSKLKSGNTKSCGCYHDECCKKRAIKHNLCNHRLYGIWCNMKTRCTNPNSEYFYLYGGKGIEVCDEWKDFCSFYKWSMDNGYADNLTIDRINNDGNYCPENCRWVTNIEQQNNTSRNHIIEYLNNKYTMKQFSDKYNISYGSLKQDLKKGKSIEEILSKNKRNTYIQIKVEDKTMSLKEWASYLNVGYTTLHSRIKYYNMSPEEAILKSLKEKNNENNG